MLPLTKQAVRKYFRGLRMASAAIVEEKRQKTPAEKLFHLGNLMELVRSVPKSRRKLASGRANWRRLHVMYAQN